MCEEAADPLHQSGYRKPLCRLDLNDKSTLKSALVDYHCVLKVKAAMDQFCEGLKEVGVLQLMKMHPSIFKPLFVADTSRALTPGKLLSAKARLGKLTSIYQVRDEQVTLLVGEKLCRINK